MIVEELRSVVTAKITDFQSKMKQVDKTLAEVQGRSKETSKKIDEIFSTSSSSHSRATGAFQKIKDAMSGLKSETARTTKVLNELDRTKLSKLKSALDLQTSQLEKQGLKVAHLKEQYDALVSGQKEPASIKAMTREVKNLEKQIADAEKVVDSYRRKIIDAERSISSKSAKGIDVSGEQKQLEALKASFERAAVPVHELSRAYEQLITKINSLKANPEHSREAEKLAAEIAEAVAQLDFMARKLDESEAKTSSIVSGFEHVGREGERAGRRTGRAFEKAGSQVRGGITKIRRALTGLWGAATKASDTIIGSFKKGLGFLTGFNLLLGRTRRRTSALRQAIFALLGARTVFALFRRVINSLGDSIKNAGRQFPAFGQKMNALTQSANQLKGAFASMFIPLINVAFPILQKVLAAVTNFFNTIATFIARLTGQKTVLLATGGVTAYDVEQMNESAKATKKAREEKEKYKQVLAGFDQLTILNFGKDDKEDEEQPEQSGGGGGGLMEGPQFTEVAVEPLIITDWGKFGRDLAKKINKAIDRIDAEKIGRNIGKKVQRGFEFAYNFLDELKHNRLGNKVADILNFAFEEIDFNLIGRTFAAGLNVVIRTGLDFVRTFRWKDFGKKISDAINGFFEEVEWDKAGQLINETILNWLDMAIETVSNMKWSDIGTKVGEMLAEIKWEEIFGKVGELISGALSGMIDMISAAITEIDKEGKLKKFTDWLDRISDWVKNNPETFAKIAKGAVAIKLISSALGMLKPFFSVFSTLFKWFGKVGGAAIDFGGKVKDTGEKVFTFGKKLAGLVTPANVFKLVIATVIIAAIVTLRNTWDDVVRTMSRAIENLGGFFKNLGDGIVRLFTGDIPGAFNSFLSAFSNLASFINNIAATITATIANLGITIANAFGANWQYISGQDIANTFEDAFGYLLHGDAHFDNVMQREGIEFKSLTPAEAEAEIRKKRGYAQGAVIQPNRPHYALLGDNTKEVEYVTPESKMKESMKQAIIEMGGLSGSGADSFEATIPIQVIVDGQMVEEQVTRRQLRRSRQFNRPALGGI